jgi:hypothetical protein
MLGVCFRHDHFFNDHNHRLFHLSEWRNRPSRLVLVCLKRSLQAIEYPMHMSQRNLNALLNRRARLRDSIQRAAHHLIDPRRLSTSPFEHFVNRSLDRMSLLLQQLADLHQVRADGLHLGRQLFDDAISGIA